MTDHWWMAGQWWVFSVYLREVWMMEVLSGRVWGVNSWAHGQHETPSSQTITVSRRTWRSLFHYRCNIRETYATVWNGTCVSVIFMSFVTYCVGLQEEPQTAHPCPLHEHLTYPLVCITGCKTSTQSSFYERLQYLTRLLVQVFHESTDQVELLYWPQRVKCCNYKSQICFYAIMSYLWG